MTLVAGACFGLMACAHGQNAAEWPIATVGQGATVMVFTGRGSMEGELLAVKDDGYVLRRRSDRKIALVPFRAVTRINASGLDLDFQLKGNAAAPASTRAKLAAISHFPQGMTPEIQAKVLAAAGQTEIVVIQ
jgi:hypothetical protein